MQCMVHPDIVDTHMAIRRGEFSYFVDEAFERHIKEMISKLERIKKDFPQTQWQIQIKITMPFWY